MFPVVQDVIVVALDKNGSQSGRMEIPATCSQEGMLCDDLEAYRVNLAGQDILGGRIIDEEADDDPKVTVLIPHGHFLNAPVNRLCLLKELKEEFGRMPALDEDEDEDEDELAYRDNLGRALADATMAVLADPLSRYLMDPEGNPSVTNFDLREMDFQRKGDLWVHQATGLQWLPEAQAAWLDGRELGRASTPDRLKALLFLLGNDDPS